MARLTQNPSNESHSQFGDFDRAELRAMVERKRRNDFVRKREFDMLRRIRREGLSPEQAAQLGDNSHLDNSDVNLTSPPNSAIEKNVKAKIDAIERQMVGGNSITRSARSASLQGRWRPPAVPPASPATAPAAPAPPVAPTAPANNGSTYDPGRPLAYDPPEPAPLVPPLIYPSAAPASSVPSRPSAPRAGLATVPSPASARPGPSAPLAPAASAATPERSARPLANLPEVEATEVVHDQELDEAVIAFANADYQHAERTLLALTGRNGPRARHEDTWLALLDMYRATGQQARFDEAATEFSAKFQKSPPQWHSLPQLVADQTTSLQLVNPTAVEAPVGWICPAQLDADEVASLATHAMQLPQPWLLDWSSLQRVDIDAASRLCALFRQWSGQAVEMHWVGFDHLFEVLENAAPMGVRDADPGFWLARLEALRLANRPDRFDEVAIDYCVTYEISPPSWVAARSTMRQADAGNLQTMPVDLSVVGESSTISVPPATDGETQSITQLELSGQLSGETANTLDALTAKLGGSQVAHISCALLIRVDFVAAGDLLNWLLARQAEGRRISFIDVNRMVALMFSAMGINQHAPIRIRND